MEKLGARKVTERVVRIDWMPDDEQWEVETESGQVSLYDRALLCG